MTKKDKILTAMQAILLEYKEKTHEASVMSCQLCRLFYTMEDSYMKESNYHTCHKCPMFVFNQNTDISCIMRKCNPVYCNEGQRNTKRLKKVTEFYERIIAVVQNLSNDEVCKPRAWKFMIEIDNEVNEKYKLVKKL